MSRLVLIACMSVLLAVAGCRSRTGELSGAVSYNGKPIRSGTVMFLADGAPAVYAPLQDDGTYQVRDVPVGAVKVTVVSPNPTPPQYTKGETLVRPSAPPAAPGWLPIPAKYGDIRTSGLTTNVTGGKSTWEIVLTD